MTSEQLVVAIFKGVIVCGASTMIGIALATGLNLSPWKSSMLTMVISLALWYLGGRNDN